MTTGRRSLRLELIATLAILLMMAVVSLSLATELLGRQRHIEQEQSRLAEHARSLAVVAAPLLGGGVRGGAEVEPVLRASVGTLGIVGIELYTVRLDGAIDRARPADVTLGLPPPAPPPTAGQATQRRSFKTPTGYTIVDEPIRAFGASAQRQSMVLRLSAQPTPWTRVGDWTQIAVIAGGTGAVLLLLGTLLVEAQVLRPMREVRNAARQVEMGNLSATVPEEGPAEVRALAEAFNTMTASLRRQTEENKTQRERLVRAEQLATVGRVAAGMAHEVGNPLAAVAGYVELLADPNGEPPLSPEQRSLLTRSSAQLVRMQNTLGQLLEYSRPAPRKLTGVPLRNAVRQLLAMTKHDPRCHGVEIEVTGDDEASATADRGMLDQVIQNLVVNGCRAARDAHPDGGARVEIHVRPSDQGMVAIDVVDNGTGVPEANRSQLFEPFFSTAPAGEGTGLGLSVSLGLVESMEGALRYEGDVNPAQSRSPAGSRFTVLLPRHGTNSED